MNSLYHRIQKIESLQKNADRDIRLFKQNTGLDCLQHCSHCCNYEDIQATALEFIPFAWHAFRLGQLGQWFDVVEKNEQPRCIFYQAREDSLGCHIYPARGLICRLFGFSGTCDKNGKILYGSCKILKQSEMEKINQARDFIMRGGRIPVISNYYRKLAAIDPVIGNEFMPINQAIKKALEIIYFHFEYRECA